MSWEVTHGPAGVTAWESGPVTITASRSGVCLWLRVDGGTTHAIRSLDDLQRVVRTIRERVRTPAGDAIVETLTEAFGRHQELAMRHALRMLADRQKRSTEGVRA